MTPRKTLRQLITRTGYTMVPGAYDPLMARLVEQAGFAAVYLTGGGYSRASGYPDLGLLSLTENAHFIGMTVEAVSIPVIADANSMTYVLHKKLGDDIVLPRGDREIRLRLVAALSDSIFQGELLMAEQPFVTLFPEQQGYQILLVQAGHEPAVRLRATLEDGMSDLGARVTGTAERLAQFHRVENTYLSTFQTLGGLGLLLGTFGLATVLLRNVLERKKELALLGAVGYRRGHVMLMVVAENVLLLVAGLTAGALSAALAIAPAVAERGSRLPFTRGSALLMIGVLVTGLLSSVIAMRAATRMPLLASLRSE